MVQTSLQNLFEDFIVKCSLFKNKEVLNTKFTPKDIPHREVEINQIAKILACSLRNEKPSNIFIHGLPGTGKSLCTSFVTAQLLETASKKNIPLRIINVNCKLHRVADTEYRLIAHIARSFGKKVPATGLPTSEVYRIFYNTLDEQNGIVVLILDEIDELVEKCGNDILYNLTRVNQELKSAQLCIVGISNNINFLKMLDPRVKSSLSEEDILFSPYNAMQLADILTERANLAFSEGAISPEVITKCAALAAREHGDSRRALALLRVAGELCERLNDDIVLEKHLDLAEEKIERDNFIEIAKSLPQQSKIVLSSLINVLNGRKDPLNTGEVYNIYRSWCLKMNTKSLTARRVTDLLCELESVGFITSNLRSFGRYGRTREIQLAIPKQSLIKVANVLKESFGIL